MDDVTLIQLFAHQSAMLDRMDTHLARQDEILAKMDERLERQNEILAKMDDRLERMDRRQVVFEDTMARIAQNLTHADRLLAEQTLAMARILERLPARP